MIRNISIGIDVGSKTTRVVVGEFVQGEKVGEKKPKIIGIGESETGGMRHGYVINSEAVTISVSKAVKMAENLSGIKIKRAIVAVAGTSLRGEMVLGSSIISKADGEVTTLDINKALSDCEDNLNLNNKKIIQTFPVSFRLDGKEVQGRLEGMSGTKLEIKALILTYSIQHLEDLIGAIAGAGVEVMDIVATPIAASEMSLSEKQKIAGVGLVNIGAETVTLSVFENGLLVSVQTFSIGGSNITNDIALGFKIPLEKAESLKIGNVEQDFSKKKLDEIIEARLTDIFESIENHLKKIKRSELLPAGIVFIGGGANISNLTELSKSVLNLPSTIGSSEIFGNTKTKLRDPAWFTALGIVASKTNNDSYSTSSLGNLFKDLKNTIKSSIKQLMP